MTTFSLSNFLDMMSIDECLERRKRICNSFYDIISRTFDSEKVDQVQDDVFYYKDILLFFLE